MTKHGPENQPPDLSAYTTDELIAVSNMIETVGAALADTFTVNEDVRPLAQFADRMDQILGELERLTVGESVRREQKSEGETDHPSDSPAERLALRSLFGEADYEFRYGKRSKDGGQR